MEYEDKFIFILYLKMEVLKKMKNEIGTLAQLENLGLTPDEKLYHVAKTYCRRLKEEERGDLYYVLLEWLDAHNSTRKSLERRFDRYSVSYCDCNGSHEIIFEGIVNDEDPYRRACKKFDEITNEAMKSTIYCVECRRLPNPYSVGMDRSSSVIISRDYDDF